MPLWMAVPAHVLQDAPELRISHQSDNAREVVRLPRRFPQAQKLQVVAPVQFDRPRVRGGELFQEGVGVEARRVAADLLLAADMFGAAAAAHDVRDLHEEHLAGELQGTLALAAPGGNLRAYPARAVLLAPQAVNVLLVEVPLGDRNRGVAHPIGLFERLWDPSLFHIFLAALRSCYYAPSQPWEENDTTRDPTHNPLASAHKHPRLRPCSSSCSGLFST